MLLSQGWQFSRDSVTWQAVSVPHDWAIAGPFDKKWDMQVVAIKENGEDIPTEHTGRSGSLPWIGKGYYRRTFTVPASAGHAELVFDGAMAVYGTENDVTAVCLARSRGARQRPGGRTVGLRL